MANKKRIGDINLLIVIQDFKKQFEQLFIDIQNFSDSVGFKEAIQKFNYCLKPSPDGIQRLPVFNDKRLSKKANKDKCVLYYISFMIQLYWQLQTGKLGLEDRLEADFLVLKECLKNGRDAYDVAGDKFAGYYLRKK